MIHYPTCRSDYPEKPKGEKPQEIVLIKLGEDRVRQCVDCGAFELEERSPKMIHETPSPLAGKTVKIKKDVKHPQVPDFGGSEYRVEDWWDRVVGESWKFMRGNPAALIYAARTGIAAGVAGIAPPTDDEVLYGKIGALGHLVHVSEIEGGGA